MKNKQHYRNVIDRKNLQLFKYVCWVIVVIVLGSCQGTQTTFGYPVKLGETNIFCINTGYGGKSPQQRASELTQRLEKFAQDIAYNPYSLQFKFPKTGITILNVRTNQREDVINFLMGDRNCFDGQEIQQYNSVELINRIGIPIENYRHRIIYSQQQNQKPINFLDLDTYSVILGEILTLIGLTIGIILAIIIPFLIYRWLTSGVQGTVVLPFEDTTGSNNEKFGKAIADSLMAEINRINYIQTYINPESENHIRLQSVNIPTLSEVTEDSHRIVVWQEDLENNLNNLNKIARSQENIENHLLAIGTVELGNTNIQIGRFFLLLKHLWPNKKVNKIISGSIQAYGKQTRLVVELAQEDELNSWEITWDNSQPEVITKMLRDLAYKVSMYLAPNITASTWKAFKYLTEGIASFHKYQQSEAIEYLYEAKQYADQAKKIKKKYAKIAELYYEIGVASLTEKKVALAVEVLQYSLQIDPLNERYHNALGNAFFSDRNWEKAEIEYKISQKINQDFPYAYNGLANILAKKKKYEDAKNKYQVAIDIYKNNHPQNTEEHYQYGFAQAHYNLGSIYLYQEKDLETAISHYQQAKKFSQNKLPFPYIGMGVAYFFKAVDTTNEREALLKNAEAELIQGLNLKQDQYDPWWNLGIIYIGLNKLAESNFHWQEAGKILKQENNQPLLIAIAQYLIEITSPSHYQSEQQLLQNIQDNLDSAEKYEKDQILKDLEVLNAIDNHRHINSLDQVIAILEGTNPSDNYTV